MTECSIKLSCLILCLIHIASESFSFNIRSALSRAHLPPTTVFPRLKTTRRCFDGRPIPVLGIFPT